MEFLDFMLKGNYKKFYNDLKVIGQKNKKNPTIMFIVGKKKTANNIKILRIAKIFLFPFT